MHAAAPRTNPKPPAKRSKAAKAHSNGKTDADVDEEDDGRNDKAQGNNGEEEEEPPLQPPPTTKRVNRLTAVRACSPRTRTRSTPRAVAGHGDHKPSDDPQQQFERDTLRAELERVTRELAVERSRTAQAQSHTVLHTPMATPLPPPVLPPHAVACRNAPYAFGAVGGSAVTPMALTDVYGGGVGYPYALPLPLPAAPAIAAAAASAAAAAAARDDDVAWAVYMQQQQQLSALNYAHMRARFPAPVNYECEVLSHRIFAILVARDIAKLSLQNTDFGKRLSTRVACV